MADITKFQNVKQNPTPEQIQQRAYEIYLERGGDDGRELEDWFAAEAELIAPQDFSLEPSPQKSKAAVAGNANTSE